MSYIFARISWPSRLRTIFRATKTHALNLAKFVSLYKTLLLLQKKVNGGKERSLDTFIAGMLGGYIVFGERNAINEQVCRKHMLDPAVSHVFSIDRFIRLLACSRVVHSSGTLALQHVLDCILCCETRTTQRAIFLHLRCTLLGHGHVDVQGTRRNYTAWHVQLDDISLPRLRPLEQFTDPALAQQVDGCITLWHCHTHYSYV